MFVAQLGEMNIKISVIISVLNLKVGVRFGFQGCYEPLVFACLELNVDVVIPRYEFSEMTDIAQKIACGEPILYVVATAYIINIFQHFHLSELQPAQVRPLRIESFS